MRGAHANASMELWIDNSTLVLEEWEKGMREMITESFLLSCCRLNGAFDEFKPYRLHSESLRHRLAVPLYT